MMKNDYIVIDLETECGAEFGRKGNFYFNDIIAIGEKAYNFDKAFSRSFSKLEQNEAINKYLESILPSFNTIIAFNAKFDLLHLWKYPALQEWLKNSENKIYDPQYVEYVLSGQNNIFPSLRDTAVNVYKRPERTKWIEDLLFNKKEPNDYKTMRDLPIDKVLEDVQNDVLDTEAIYLEQQKRIAAEGMEILVDTLMDGLLSLIEMEYNGFYINKDILEKNRQTQESKLQLIEKDINQIIERNWI